MATPETGSVELDPHAPSFDGQEDVAESEEELVVEELVVEADTRELPAYSFDSSDKTLVGIGSSGSAESSPVRHFDSSDRTLVGIGPAERAKRAKLAKLSSDAQQAEVTPDSVPMPPSEPPGPFVASDAHDDAPSRSPTRTGARWVLASSAVLVAAAVVALLRGVVPHTIALHAAASHPATTVAPSPAPNEPLTPDMQLESVAATSAATFAVELPIAQPTEAPLIATPLATAQRAQQPELAPRRVIAKAAGSEALGALDITSNPPTSLVLDGRPVGKAPRVVQLPSGPHTVLFIHPERGRMSVTVNVRAGRTTSASADF